MENNKFEAKDITFSFLSVNNKRFVPFDCIFYLFIASQKIFPKVSLKTSNRIRSGVEVSSVIIEAPRRCELSLSCVCSLFSYCERYRGSRVARVLIPLAI